MRIGAARTRGRMRLEPLLRYSGNVGVQPHCRANASRTPGPSLTWASSRIGYPHVLARRQTNERRLRGIVNQLRVGSDGGHRVPVGSGEFARFAIESGEAHFLRQPKDIAVGVVPNRAQRISRSRLICPRHPPGRDDLFKQISRITLEVKRITIRSS